MWFPSHPLSCICMYIYIYILKLSCFSHVQLFATLQTVAPQAPLSLGFSRQEYWSGLQWPLPGPRDRTHNSCSYCSEGRLFTAESLGKINICVAVYVYVLVALSYLTLCYPTDCSLPGSSIHGIFQAKVLEWVAISFSRGSSQSRDQTPVSCIADRCFTIGATREAQLYICIYISPPYHPQIFPGCYVTSSRCSTASSDNVAPLYLSRSTSPRRDSVLPHIWPMWAGVYNLLWKTVQVCVKDTCSLYRCISRL